VYLRQSEAFESRVSAYQTKAATQNQEPVVVPPSN
jgi:hypothetical protein